jgi:release factor glutamine methyltransferase
MVDSWDDLAGKRKPLLLELSERWRTAGIDVMVLRGPGPDDMAWTSQHNTLDLLVHPQDANEAQHILHDTEWRFEIGTIGVLRRLRSAAYIYDGGPALYLNWGVPFTPLPSRMLSGLEDALWTEPHRTEDGWLVPADHPLLLYLAVQASRPGRLHRVYDWAQFCKSVPPPEERWGLIELAGQLKLSRLLDRALRLADEGGDRPGGPAIDGGWGSFTYRFGEQIRKRAPRRIRAFAKTPEPGDVSCVARFAGVELENGPPAFCPMHATESFLPPAEEKIGDRPAPVIVDAGTGVGAVGLAISTSHPEAEIHGTDTGKVALRWARRNASRLGKERARFYRGSLTEPLPAGLRGRVDVVFANLPYYPEKRYVPVGAIARDAIQGTDEDGLGLYRALAKQAVGLLKPEGRLIMQMFAWQWDYFKDELATMGLEPRGVTEREPFVIGWADRSDQP